MREWYHLPFSLLTSALETAAWSFARSNADQESNFATSKSLMSSLDKEDEALPLLLVAVLPEARGLDDGDDVSRD